MRVDAVASRAVGEASNRERGDVHRDEVKVDSVTILSSLSLLRCWAHNSRATYERKWRHHVGVGSEKLVFEVSTVEGDGAALELEKKLHFFAEPNERNEAAVCRLV